TFEFLVLLYIPKNIDGKAPAFVYPNFWGNYSLTDEKEIPLPDFRYSGGKKVKIKEKERGSRDRLPVRDIIARGFATATFAYCDVYPDLVKEDGAKQSIYKIFHKDPKYPECMPFPAWAWGNMRVMDLLQTQPEIDCDKVAVVGHSRLGKTAIITGAYDTRFAYVIANNSGCMGDALSKRKYGENIHAIANVTFLYWLLPQMKKYANNEGELPLDQHHLLATIAPRMLYCASATEDVWADPEGELLGLMHACPAFALFGTKNFPTLDALEIEKPFHGDVAYHIRKGKHNITPYDWKNFMDYAQKHGWNPKKK
ncbi:MAG: acetylxylan esterase, partial [Opitutales bacterium]|nr:acetylxylan esterase [Opitutales bacterium]